MIYFWSGNELDFREGTLYPTLHQLEDQGMIAITQEAKSGRRTRSYRLTPLGREQLDRNREEWQRYSRAVNRVLGAMPDDDEARS